MGSELSIIWGDFDRHVLSLLSMLTEFELKWVVSATAGLDSALSRLQSYSLTLSKDDRTYVSAAIKLAKLTMLELGFDHLKETFDDAHKWIEGDHKKALVIKELTKLSTIFCCIGFKSL